MNSFTNYEEGFGERIRAVRRKAQLSQAEFGEQLDVTRQSINGYETERIKLSRRTVEKVCGLYNVKPWWLLYGIRDVTAVTGDNAPKREIEYQPEREQGLTPTQKTLIDFIKADKDAARQLAKQLWERAIRFKPQ